MSEPYLGEVRLVGFTFAPRGNSLCQGQIIAVQANTALFSLLGTSYGGNGQQTFGLPDLQGRVAVGAGNGAGLPVYTLGEKAGNYQAQLTINNLPSHTHSATSGAGTLNGTLSGATATGNISIPALNTAGATNVPNPNRSLAASLATDPIYAPNPNTTLAPFSASLGVSGNVSIPVAQGGLPITVGATGSGIPVSTQPPFLAINYIIALQGIFPTRS
jgi:microcystin-dependent protein